jgi:hypothetical protein
VGWELKKKGLEAAFARLLSNQERVGLAGPEGRKGEEKKIVQVRLLF